jgi:hypothetical protein
MEPWRSSARSGDIQVNDQEAAIIIFSLFSSDSEKISRISLSAGRSGALRIRGEVSAVLGAGGVSGIVSRLGSDFHKVHQTSDEGEGEGCAIL